ncbi:MAG: MFS transporter [Alphaproteobacteria bacterium]|nr:MFS transporter [Alphaproteobacteria bacterium]MBU0796224.1 MFS transporter [Alphaproteobacteria bacterium]MBU1813109.1 MFS transporter [Alphaproteobacteria bacterium]
MNRPASIPVLTVSTSLAHGADQLALAALPLVAALALKADAALIGLLVAAQSAAWLVVSLPAGAMIDRLPKRRLLVTAQLLAAFAFALAALAAASGFPAALGASVFLGAAGTVIFVLAGFAAVPGLASPADLPRVNARLELARAVATLAAPVLAGAAAQAGLPALALAGASLAALLAATTARRLPPLPPVPSATPRPALGPAIAEGAGFVLRHPLLRAIAACAITWNIAFFMLAACFIPFALNRLGLSAGEAGIALGGYGVGLLLGALAAPHLVRRWTPGVMLTLGPALSVLAGLALVAGPQVPGLALPILAHFLIGFGPMLWQVSQTSLRQIVTPPALLGRVGATMQVAVFGVRPLGALAGGAIATGFGLDAAMIAAALGFALSTLVILLSPLVRLKRMPDAVTA